MISIHLRSLHWRNNNSEKNFKERGSSYLQDIDNKASIMGPRHEEGLDNETNFFIQCENEKEEPTDYKKDKVEGDQILDAIGSTKFLSSSGLKTTSQ